MGVLRCSANEPISDISALGRAAGLAAMGGYGL